jgi:hypothetical protein
MVADMHERHYSYVKEMAERMPLLFGVNTVLKDKSFPGNWKELVETPPTKYLAQQLFMKECLFQEVVNLASKYSGLTEYMLEHPQEQVHQLEKFFDAQWDVVLRSMEDQPMLADQLVANKDSFIHPEIYHLAGYVLHLFVGRLTFTGVMSHKQFAKFETEVTTDISNMMAGNDPQIRSKVLHAIALLRMTGMIARVIDKETPDNSKCFYGSPLFMEFTRRQLVSLYELGEVHD